MAYSLGFRVLDYTLFRSNILRDHAHLSFCLCRRVRHRPVGAGWGLFRRSRPRDPGRPARAHQRVHHGAQADRAEIRGAGRVGSRRLQRDQRHAPDARSALELHGPEGLRAAARAPGRALLRAGHHDQRARRRYHRHGAVRGFARLQEGHSPRRCHREDQRRGCQRVDERAGGAEAARAERHPRSGVHSPHRLRQADRRRGRARRNQDSERPVGVHDQPDDRLHPAARFLRNDRPRARRGAARPYQAGHEAGAARYPREPRRPAGSGHQGVEPVPQEGGPDRLYARTYRELRPGLPRASKTATTRICR